ncbi:P-loop containing nucleoside triphosphate hydrolase protein [Trichophaea hybrida]|nr:P-loop containing nucleoside triphosphate hydrolase protein [Trichophaea hybrida]
MNDSDSQSAHADAENTVVEAMDIDSTDNYGDVPLPARKQLFEIVVPTLEELARDRNEYQDFGNEFADDGFPEHARVIQVIKELERNDGCLWYRARFSNAEVMEVPFERLATLYGGNDALQRFLNGRPQRDSSSNISHGSDEDETLSPVVNNARKTRQRRLISLRDRRRAETASRTATAELSEEDSEAEAGPAPRRGRRTTRSQGLREVRMLSYKKGPYSDDEDDDIVSGLLPRPSRRSNREVARNAGNKSRRRNDSDDEFGSEQEATRRSGRAKRRKANYAEPDLDDEFIGSDLVLKPTKPKVLHAKEIFPVLDDDDEFVLTHNLLCDACQVSGHSSSRGKIICCQGCSASFHKDCIGTVRTAREHLITKISDENFVMQCKRCIGRYKLKDSLQASFDRCTSCNNQGSSCIPFKPLSEKKRAPTQDSRAVTPDTEVSTDLLYNPDNVLFRCSNCYRAWHYEHLPQRGSKRGRADLDDVRKQRIEQYTRNFKCVDCISAPGKISNIIAWRPVDPESRLQDTRLDLNDFTEDEREYLIKFEDQSYFHVQWYPGPWVAGAFVGKRNGFVKNHSPAVLTQGEAIEEGWLRVDIVLDVEYTSIVPMGNDVEIDLARIKEVRSALVKYKGLGYDEVFWDAPPKVSDTERWEDWRRAYDDYVHGLYVKPAKGTMKKLEKARRTDFESLELKGQPKYIKGGTLMEYQKEGMNWLYYKWWNGQNAILADEMGLGKTIQIISFLAILFEEQKLWPFLIVVPHSTVPNWRREIQTWAPNLRVVSYYGADIARKLARAHELFHKNGDLKCHIVVTSYSTPTTDAGVLRKIPWQGLIVDEGQRLKNDGTQLYLELQKYKIHHKVLLTGTPLQNNPRELFNLLQFLEPKEMKAQDLEEEFGVLTSENVPRLHALIRPFFLRRTKAQVLTHLPPMAEVIVPVSMTPLQRKLYKSILSKDAALIRSILYRGDKIKQTERAKLNNLLMQLRKCVCHPFLYNEDIEEITDENNMEMIHRNLVEAGSKLGLLNIMLPKLKARGHRVLIFSQFLGMLDIIEDFLSGLEMKFHRLDGSVSTLEKQKRIDEFNAPGSEYFAFLLSTRAGGVGINLATADTVIILDPDFNPHQDIQALSRAHRIGQKNKVLVFHLMTRDTAEERIMQIGKKKLSLDHLIIEKMGGEDGEEEIIDVESILSFGAKRLFEDDVEDRVIKYDDEGVDKLLDRSSIEQTKTTNENGDGSAENAFSFARVWANDKGSLEDNAFGNETPEDDATPEPGFWEKVLQEREAEAQREAAAKQQELGRGRRRKNVSYIFHDDDGTKEDNSSDTDFQEDGPAQESEDSMDEHGMNGMDLMDLDGSMNNVRRSTLFRDDPISQTQIYIPLVNGNGAPAGPTMGTFAPPLPSRLPAPPVQIPSARLTPGLISRYQPPGPLPPGLPLHNDNHRNPKYTPSTASREFTRVDVIQPTDDPAMPFCQACRNHHAQGACTLKQSGVEYCPICKLAHFPKASICPHFESETQIKAMMEALRQSTEDKALVDEAKRYLRGRRAQLQKEKRERKAKEVPSLRENGKNKPE